MVLPSPAVFGGDSATAAHKELHAPLAKLAKAVDKVEGREGEGGEGRAEAEAVSVCLCVDLSVQLSSK